MRPSAFRDPPPLDGDAAALRAELARILVRAPSLPVYLPPFRMSLIDVVPVRGGFALVVGGPDPAARLRIERPQGPDGLAPLRARKRGFVGTVTVELVGPGADKVTRELALMAARVRDALDEVRWEEACAVAKRLARLPVGVPLEYFRQIVPGVSPPQGLVRVGFGCNQDCGFCWQDRGWARFEADQIRVWIEDLARAGMRSLTISGGEPTLDPRLEEYVRAARALGFDEVVVETNAVQMAKAGYAVRLRDAGLTEAFVSFHSADPAVSDAMTRAPGTHGRTVLGTKALLDAGVHVVLNAVMTAESLASLPAMPDYLRATFGAHPMLRLLVLSYPTEAFDPALTPLLLPDPRRVREVLPRVIARAEALGITLSGLDGPCGPPLCAFGADPRVTALRAVPEPVPFRRQVAACTPCSVRHACFGVRESALALYGDACVAPIPETLAS